LKIYILRPCPLRGQCCYVCTYVSDQKGGKTINFNAFVDLPGSRAGSFFLRGNGLHEVESQPRQNVKQQVSKIRQR